MGIKLSSGLLYIIITGWIFLAMGAHADTLVYSEHNSNPSWFSPDNWFEYDSQNHLQPVFHPPVAGDTAIVSGGVDAQGNLIQLAGLILGANASIQNGGFVVGTITMNGGQSGGTTTFNGSVVEVLTEMDVIGGSCLFENGTLTIDFGAICNIGFNGEGQLTYSGSQLINDGQISLQFTGSFLEGGTNLINRSGAIISSSTNTYITGANTTFDNSGTVRSDHGTLNVSGFRNWPSASGISKYKTTASDALILFSSSLTIPAGVTNIFSGIGTNILTGMTNNGTAQVGVIPDGTQNLDPGVLEFGGTITGAGAIHVVALPNQSSIFMVNPNVGGTMTGVTVNIDPGGQFLIEYVSNAQGITLLATVINNSGTLAWNGFGGIIMNGGALINNLIGALCDAQIPLATSGSISGGKLPGGGAINNSGTFRKSSGSAAVVITADFNNIGLLDVQNGQVQLAGGTNSGSFNTASGTEISISANNITNYFAPGAQFSGTNFIRAKAGTIYLTGNITLAAFSMEGGTLDGPGGITVSNIFLWSNGNMQGRGTMTIPAGANATLTGGFFTQRTINNSGTVTMTNSFIGADDGAIFNNLAGGQLVVKKDGGFGFPNSDLPSPVLNNFGSVMDTSTTTAPLAFIITNRGSILVQSNSLNCYQYVQVAGTIIITTNGTLNSGALAPVLLGGLVTGNGTINSSFGVTNSGATILPGNSPGVLTINGNGYTQTAAGTLSIEIGGTNAGSQFDRLTTTAGVLNGTLKVSLINGFQPAVGNIYFFLTTQFFGGITGTFANYIGLETSNHIALVPIYQGFGVSLVAVAQPVITGPTRKGTNSIISFQTTSGLTNVVQFTDSLNPPNWQTLTNILGDGTVRSVTNGTPSTQRYYRVGFR
jgi:fibronectin-binding autotransporter adhesin